MRTKNNTKITSERYKLPSGWRIPLRLELNTPLLSECENDPCPFPQDSIPTLHRNIVSDSLRKRSALRRRVNLSLILLRSSSLRLGISRLPLCSDFSSRQLFLRLSSIFLGVSNGLEPFRLIGGAGSPRRTPPLSSSASVPLSLEVAVFQGFSLLISSSTSSEIFIS